MTALLERCKVLGFALLGAWIGAFALTSYSETLRAAGLNGKAPPNGDAFKTFISQMSDNAIWIIGTVVGLAMIAIGGMFLLGHSRAQDYAAKIALGVGLIILAPGIAA